MIHRARRPILPLAGVLSLFVACGPSGTASGPRLPAGERCASRAPDEMPGAVLVERSLSHCAERDDPRVLCLEALDDPGFPVLAWVGRGGQLERLAGDPATGVQASDARALEGGGHRYVRVDAEGASELVTVSPDGVERIVPGGASRPVLLGGRTFGDPSDRAGTLRAELSTEPPYRVELVDTLGGGGEGAPVAEIPLGDDIPVGRHAFVADDGSRFAALVRDGPELVWRVHARNGDRLERRVIEGAATATPLAAGPRLEWVVLVSDVRGVVVSGPGPADAATLSPVSAAAFDPCARWLYLVGGPGPSLLRIALDTGEVEALRRVPGWIERLEPTPDGALLVGSSLPGGAAGERRALVMSPFGDEVVEIALPEDTERVSAVLR